jgi:signal peptidase I
MQETMPQSAGRNWNALDLPRPKLKRWGLLGDALELIVWIALVYALVNLASVRFVVKGASMEPTFHDGQYLIVSRMNYLFTSPKQGDVIVFHYPNNTEEDYIKRIIGVPGDVVEIRDTLVYVNDRALDEPYIKEPCRPSNCSDLVTTLGENQYFVMGDNRNNSRDSRSFGAIEIGHIVGEVLVRYWPPEDWGIWGW